MIWPILLKNYLGFLLYPFGRSGDQPSRTALPVLFSTGRDKSYLCTSVCHAQYEVLFPQGGGGGGGPPLFFWAPSFFKKQNLRPQSLTIKGKTIILRRLDFIAGRRTMVAGWFGLIRSASETGSLR